MHLDGVVEGGGGENLIGREIVPNHVHDAPAGDAAHARMIGIRRRDRRGAGQRHAERFGNRHHGRGRAHDHAGAERAGDAAFDLIPFLIVDIAGAFLGPVFPDVRAGAEIFALPVAAQHRAGGNINCRNAHADRAHQQAGRGLVAATHQHRAVDRLAAQQLLGLHRQHVAIEHRRRLHEGFGQRHRRQLKRKAAGLQHAAFDAFGARAQMRVARVDIAPGIDDADDRLAGPIGCVVAHAAHARAVSERAHVVDTEPTMAAQILGAFTDCHENIFALARSFPRKRESSSALGPRFRGDERRMMGALSNVNRSTDWRRARPFPTWPSRRREIYRNRPACPPLECRRAP